MLQDISANAGVIEYFRALRAEIIEAQKLRIGVGLAKTVFLGTLIGFFFKDGKGDPAILICPFVALMFDCMVYGLSFNIKEIGLYISEHLEGQMGLQEPWERLRAGKLDRGIRDWGRIVFRVGSYGLSGAVAVFSFAETVPSGNITTQPAPWLFRITLAATLTVAWGTLMYREVSSRRAVTKAPEITVDRPTS